MKIIVTDSFKEMSNVAKNILFGYMCEDRRINLSITSGRTPKLIYEQLIPLVKNNKSFHQVHYYSFDETPILNLNGSFAYPYTKRELDALFFEPALIPQENIHTITEENYQNYDKIIEQDGGLDCMIIGIGADGHFCANMPESTKFEDESYKVPLDDRYPWLNDFKKEIEGFEADCMVTMGPRSIMKAKHLILIANDKEKAEIVKTALEGPVTESIPASILKLHPNFTVILDKEAAENLSSETLDKYL